jgi:hypothetical protein
MRVTYTLLWDEFAELYTDSWPKPNVVAIVATVGFAMAFGVFGNLLARALGPDEWRVGLAFYGFSGFLLGLAIWELKGRTARLKKQKVREVRSLYERFYSREQVFTIDQEKWGHETETSKKETTWAGLLNAVERQNVVALVGKDQLTVVPKRTLSQDTLDLLRQSALRIPGTKCHFRPSFWNWAMTEFTLPWKDQPFAMLGGYALGVGALVIMVRHLAGSAKPGDFFWGELLCASVLFIIVTAQFWNLVLHYIASYDDLGLPFEAEFSEQGMRVKRPKMESFRAWVLFRKFQENRLCFILHADVNRHYVLAKSSFSPEDRQAIRVMLQTKVATD